MHKVTQEVRKVNTQAYQHYNSETEQWEDFPEFVKFNQPTWSHTPEHFSAWVIKNTPDGRVMSSELMREG